MPVRSPYSDYEKEQAIAAWVIGGTFVKAEQATGIKADTIANWRDTHPEWWEATVLKIRAAYEDQHRAGLTKIIEAGLREALERLENGDERIDTKTGELRRVKVSARDAATITGICVDKLRLSLGQPTSISSKTADSTDDKLKKLRDAAKQRAIKSGAVADIDSKRPVEQSSEPMTGTGG